MAGRRIISSRRMPARLLMATLLSLLVMWAAFGQLASASDPSAPTETLGAAPAPWPEELLETLATVPVQSEGRVKPLYTWARYTLLGMNHKSSAIDAWGRRQEPLAWLLDSLLRPEAARRSVCFLVSDDEVLDAIGLPRRDDKKKRDRYSYEDLEPARAQLRDLGSTFAHMEATDRTRVQTFVMELAHDVARFEGLLRYLDFARSPKGQIPVGGALAKIFDGRESVGVVEFLAQSKQVVALARASAGGTQESGGAMSVALEKLTAALGGSQALHLFPPIDETTEDWLSPYDVAAQALMGQAPPSSAHLEMLSALRDAAAAQRDPAVVSAALSRFQRTASDLATKRGEFDKVGLEVWLASFDPFFKALWIYVLAFLLLAVSWLRSSRWIVRAAVGLLVAGLVLHIAGISIRCVLRERPPVSTLYETVLFISVCMVAACLAIERMDRRGVALSVAPVVGALGLFIANRYEVLKGEDTMPQLVAVLDTNFWLTVHVLCITIGYAGGLLASALAHVHVLGRVFGLRRGDATFDRSLARMVYGTLCFALLFSVVGTILGGIWANESWGRFWGWDPKENGALMIVLVQLAILHGRMGGIFKSFGISMATIASGIVVAFSWWGVNLLGIGLHSYGHTSGVAHALQVFYGIEFAVLVLGGLWWVRQRPASAGAA